MIRAAVRGDMETIVRIQAGAFQKHYEEDASRLDRLRENLSRKLAGWLMFEKDGKTIGCAHVLPQTLRIGKAKIVKGDLGYVAIPPEYQGQGLGHQLLTEALAWMKEQDYDLSRLGGLVKFYRRFGYQRFFRRFLEIKAGIMARAGASMVQEGELPMPEVWKKAIRRFSRKKDETSFLAVRSAFQKNYQGSMDVSPKELGVPGESPLALVFEDKGKIVAYLLGGEYPEEMTEAEARITIGEVGYRRGYEHGLAAMLLHVHNLALEKGIHRITVRTPFDPEFIRVLSTTPVRFNLVETYEGASGNMLQVVNLRSLIEHLVPELEARIKGSTWQGTILLQIEKDEVRLAAKGGRIRVGVRGKGGIKLSIKEFYLMQMVLGMLSFDEIRHLVGGRKLRPRDAAFLNDLFPRRAVYSGVWG